MLGLLQCDHTALSGYCTCDPSHSYRNTESVALFKSEHKPHLEFGCCDLCCLTTSSTLTTQRKTNARLSFVHCSHLLHPTSSSSVTLIITDLLWTSRGVMHTRRRSTALRRLMWVVHRHHMLISRVMSHPVHRMMLLLSTRTDMR